MLGCLKIESEASALKRAKLFLLMVYGRPMRTVLIFAFAVVLATTAQAQDMLPPPKSRALAWSIMSDALDNISQAECDKGRRCAPTTPEEKANPPLSLSEADFAIRRAILSEMANACGLDWKSRSFIPMMQFARDKLRKNDRQLAIIGVIHEIIFDMPKREKIDCNAKMRAEVEQKLSQMP